MGRNSSSDAALDAAKLTPHTGRVKLALNALQFTLDVGLLIVAFVVGYGAREVLPFFPQPAGQPALLSYVPTMVLHVVTIIVIFYFSKLYHQRRVFSRIDQFRDIIAVVTIGALLANALQEFFFRNSPFDVTYPRSMLFYVWFFSLVFVGLGRELQFWLTITLRKRGIASDNLLIVGTGRVARDIMKRIQRSPSLGYRIVGVVTARNEHQGRMLGVPIVGNYEDLSEIIDDYNVEQVIIAIADVQRDELVNLVTLCQRGHVDIKIYPDMFAYMAGDLNVDDLGGTPLLTVRDISLRGWRLSLKRALDLTGAILGLIFLSPLMLLTAFLIYLDDGGPIFFTQERMGLDGRPFPMIKFRSMRVDAEVGGPGWTTPDDPRRTRIGALMRRTNWDEIPQLINVLLGHMSLVGPRPERPVYVQQFRENIPRYMERHREKAGMTGWAQIHGLRGDTSVEDRTAYDLWYVENWSLWLDIKILIRTVIMALTGRSLNAY